MIFLSLVLFIAIVRFGAVEPEVTFALAIAFALGFLVYLLNGARTRAVLELRVVLLAALCAALAVFVDAKLALAAMAGVCAWMAARKRPASLVYFFHFLLLVGILEALLGLFQYFVAPGWILGYISDSYSASGTLINRNHFAGLLGMLIPVAIGLAYTSWVRYRDPGRTYLYLLAGSVMGLALAFSLSRMGIISFVLTLGLVSVLVRWSHSPKLGTLFALVPVFLILTGAAWIGVDVIVERFERLLGPDSTIQDARAVIFQDTVRMIADNPMGIGVGAYADTFRRYQTDHNELLFDHAHNDYLETAAEWGLPIAVLFWAGIFVVFGRTARQFLRSRDTDERGILLAATGAMCSILIHSLVDFNLQIPSNAMLFASFVGIAIAVGKPLPNPKLNIEQWQLNIDHWALPLLPALALPIVVISSVWGAFMGAWITRDASADPTVYERALEYDPGNSDYHFTLAQLRSFSTAYLDPDLAREHYLRAVELDPDRSGYWLELSRSYEEGSETENARLAMARALEADPNDADTHWAAANLYVRLGDLAEADRTLVRTAELDATYVTQVLDLVWYFYQDAERAISTYVPDTKDANLIGLRYFLAQNDSTGARLAWDRLRRFETDPRERLSYVNFLVNQGMPHEAYQIFLPATIDASRPAVFNGSFEAETLNGGFDWRYSANGSAEVRRDTTQSRDGAASLLVRFSGEDNVNYSHISHWLAVEEGRSYELKFWMRSEGITTDKGVYVEVDGERSDPVLGTTFWQEVTIPFEASSDLVTVRVRRDPSQRFDNLLAGRLWLDAFELAAR